MTKNILNIALSSMFLLGAPVVANAEPMIEIVDFMAIDNVEVNISVTQNVLHVSGAAGQVLHIYNVAGVCVSTLKIDGDDKHFDLNLPKGCYIVKVGKIVRKISIR